MHKKKIAAMTMAIIISNFSATTLEVLADEISNNTSVLEINDNIEIYIRDNGTGIDENDIPNLFKPYFSRRQGGTGLGLAIVKKIVEEHSGTITADNNDAGGAYFKIILPRGL